MTSKPQMQAGSTGTSTIPRTSKPSDDNLLKELIPYFALSRLTGSATDSCSPDTVNQNDYLSTSDLPQTQDSNCEITNKLVPAKHDTVSDVEATQKMAEYSHNSSSFCSFSPFTVQLREDFGQAKAEALMDEKRAYGIKETDSGCTAGSVQELISDFNIIMSCNAEINTKEDKNNNTHKISNNNKENHVVNSTDNVNIHKELFDILTELAQQTATADVLEEPWEIAEMFTDEDSIWAVDSGCISGDVQALNTGEDKIPVSWNADINSEENISNSKQKVSNTTKGNCAGNSKEMVNSIEKLSDAEIGYSQHSGRDVLRTPYKTGLSCFCNSRENNFIAPEVTSSKDGLQHLDFPVTILGSETICPPANMPATSSASNKSAESLTKAETPTTCTSRVPSKCSSVTKITGVHHTVTKISAAKNSSEEQEETKSTARKINYANTGTKKSKKQSSAGIYSGIPSNIPTKFLQCVSKFSQTVSTVVPKCYSKGHTSATLPLTPEQIFNNIMVKHYPRTVRRHLFSTHLHIQKCTPTILQPNQKSNTTPTKMPNKLYPKFRVIAGNSYPGRPKVRNSRITEQSEGTKRKYTKSKITKNNQKDDGKIKKKRAYARKPRHIVCNNNSKSTTPPPPPNSTDTDASCSKECQKRVTRKDQHIPHQNISENCDNHFSCKSNHKSARMSGKQMQTSKASTQTFTSASPCELVIKHMNHSYKPSDSNRPIIMDDLSSDNMSTQYSTVITSSNFQNHEQQTGSQFQYSVPLITEHEHNCTVSGDIHHNIYTAYQQEQMSQMQHNEKYFTSSQNLAELYTGMYEDVDTWGDINKLKSNQEFPMKEVERRAGQQLTEYEHNFTKLSDDIYHLYAANDQQLTWQLQYNNQYFPSSQNTEELLHTDMHKNVSTWGEAFNFMRNHELPHENVGRHIQQPNDYETSIIQNGNQNVMNEREPNSYGYLFECKRTKLNDEDFQWYEAHNHMDACNSINNYCEINLPTQTENFANCQPSSKIGFGHQSHYDQALSAKRNSEEVQQPTFTSNEDIYHEQIITNQEYTQTENFANRQPPSKIGYGHQSHYDQAFSAERNSEEVQQPTFTSNEDIYHEQIITNQEYTNGLPTTEMFCEEAWQEQDFYTSHKHTGMEQTYFNNGENITQNWEAQTSNDPLTTYNN